MRKLSVVPTFNESLSDDPEVGDVNARTGTIEDAEPVHDQVNDMLMR